VLIVCVLRMPCIAQTEYGIVRSSLNQKFACY
jgi:hypothetical protein